MINILIKNFKDMLKSNNLNYEIVSFDSKSDAGASTPHQASPRVEREDTAGQRQHIF
jgi:hypothetical protein